MLSGNQRLPHESEDMNRLPGLREPGGDLLPKVVPRLPYDCSVHTHTTHLKNNNLKVNLKRKREERPPGAFKEEGDTGQVVSQLWGACFSHCLRGS